METHLTKLCTCGNQMYVLTYEEERSRGIYVTDRSFDRHIARRYTCYLARSKGPRLTRGIHCATCNKYHGLASFKSINPVEEVLGGY